MGWVEQKIKDRQAAHRSLHPLWNSLRDSIGGAVLDFQSFVNFPHIGSQDCKARGSLCVRVEKSDMSFIEVFLVADDQTIRTARDDAETIIAKYRLDAKRSNLEFYTESEKGAITVSAEHVSELALCKFLFEPFPTSTIKRLV